MSLSDRIIMHSLQSCRVVCSVESHYGQRDLLPLTTKRTRFHGVTECKDQPDTVRPCICTYEICIGWYPCGLKYCKGQDSSGKTVNYRCGIKTCKKCRSFRFYATRKLNCMWNESDEDMLFFKYGAPESRHQPDVL